MATFEIESLISWLKEQEMTFNDYLNDIKKHKIKALSPKVQGQVMASAGVVAFINAELDYLNQLKEEV